MTTPQDIYDAIGRVKDQPSFIRELLVNALDWPIDEDIEDLEGISYTWTAEDLRAGELNAGDKVWQIRPFNSNQPWGVFLLEFNNEGPFAAGRGMTGTLRKVLRGLVPSRRRSPELTSWDRENLLFIATYKYRHFRFAYFKPPRGKSKTPPLAHFGWLKGDTHIRTLCEYNLSALAYPDDDQNAEEWLGEWSRAFDVERVTKKFFDDYCKIAFFPLKEHLKQVTQDAKWRHRYALQFLNRLMFLYFVQCKRWLGNDRKFLRTLWAAYDKSERPKDSFVHEWLGILFFEAFNKKFHAARHDYLPPDVCEAFETAPFLNGGLFKRNEIDRQHKPRITDEMFGQILNFLESYNFTIAEDTPFDEEVAVDPLMIGKVYESLVNVSEDIDERGDAGIFYTPRTEIDLMCRLTLVDYLSNHIPGAEKGLLYELVFAHPGEELAAVMADRRMAKVWPRIETALKQVTVADPACGSGSFLVAMLNILADLIPAKPGRTEADSRRRYNLKKDIIARSLYGVDVKEWAVQIAELRLWLQLVVDRKSKPIDETEPLLPDLTFKIRQGDSLVEEFGGHVFSIRHNAALSGTRLVSDIKDIVCLKDAHFQAAGDAGDVEAAIRKRKIALFDAVIQDLRDKAHARLAQIEQGLAAKQHDFEYADPSAKQNLKRKALEEERDALLERKAQLQQICKDIKSGDFSKTFFWELDFPEVFSREDRSGFDIVIGNPPYVRQERIADPQVPPEKANTTAAKKAYKAKLQESVRVHFGNSLPPKLDMKSDLYIYFYLHGLSLLNPKGTFCFITSNSWLDVGYGKDLQEFLLRNCHVKMIIDNKVKRTFASADVNTIIALLSAPQKERDAGLARTARFVMFKEPFEHVIHPVIFEEIEEATERKSTPEYRVMPKNQELLLEEGLEQAHGAKGTKKTKVSGPLIKVARYIGNKWGGKYLRAPDIYWTILQKGKGKLARLGDIAVVRRGFTTGANEFFYLDTERILEWGIQKEFLTPVIVSPRNCCSIQIRPEDMRFNAFICSKAKNELRGTNALAYIKWGEQRGFNLRPSCRNRSKWYEFPLRDWATVLWPMIHNDRQSVFWNGSRVAVDHNLFEIKDFNDELTWGSLFWTAQLLCRELHGRANLGQGALKTEGIDIRTFYVLCLRSGKVESAIASARLALAKRPIGSVRDECKKPDHVAFDSILFDIIGLTRGEREAVYEAVINLVEARLSKAESV